MYTGEPAVSGELEIVARLSIMVKRSVAAGCSSTT